MVVASVEVEHRLDDVETTDFPISDSDIPSNLGCTCWRTNHGCIAAEVDEGVTTSLEAPSRRITRSMSRRESSIPSPLSLFCITLV